MKAIDTPEAKMHHQMEKLPTRTLEVIINDAEYRLDSRDYSGMAGHGRLEEDSLRRQLHESIELAEMELDAREADRQQYGPVA